MSRPDNLKEALPGMLRVMRYFWPHVRKYRGLIAGSLAALLAEVGLRLLEPWPLKFVFDHLLVGSAAAPAALPPVLVGFSPMTLLALAAVAVVAFTGLRAVASYGSAIGFARIGSRVLRKVRDQLYRHVQYLSLSFHTRARTGDLVVRVITDVGLLQDVAVTALLPLIAKGLIVVSMVGLMFYLKWQLALAAVAVLPLFWLRTVRLSRKIREVARKQRHQEGLIAATAAESINAIRTVQTLSLEETFARAFSAESDKVSREDIKGKRLSAALERSVDVLVAVATGLVVWYGGVLAMRGEITPGDLLVFLAYLKYAYRPVQDFAKYTGRLAKASAAGERVIDLLDRVPDVRDLPGAVCAPAFTGRLQLAGVSFAYEHGQKLLKRLQLEVPAGRQVALVGPSGGGKTTILSLILRLYDPLEGRVLIDGRDVREFTLESLRNQISVVLQDNLLFAASIRANIAYTLPQATDAEVEAAARLANAHEFITALPQGYATVVGEKGVTLSHGQRQRIAIARAAIRRAPILLLDEPTTGLDKENERAVLDALQRLYAGRTTVVITHNLQEAARADQILFLERGLIVESGTHEELVRQNGRYAAMYRLQAGDVGEPGPGEAHAIAR